MVHDDQNQISEVFRDQIFLQSENQNDNAVNQFAEKYVMKTFFPCYELKWRILSQTSTEQSGKNIFFDFSYWASSTP